MVVEHFKPGCASYVYARFQEQGRMLPDGLEYVDSWVNVERTKCFQLMKTGDEGLFQKWTENWNDLVDFEIFPVISSSQTQEIMIDNRQSNR